MITLIYLHKDNSLNSHSPIYNKMCNRQREKRTNIINVFLSSDGANPQKLFLSKSFCFFNGEQQLFLQLLITLIGWQVQAVKTGMTSR